MGLTELTLTILTDGSPIAPAGPASGGSGGRSPATVAAFTALSAAALWHHDYWGLIEPQLRTLGGMQVLADLVIALGLFVVRMGRDAKSAGRTPWPRIALTLVAGSIGPLLYLIAKRKVAR